MYPNFFWGPPWLRKWHFLKKPDVFDLMTHIPWTTDMSWVEKYWSHPLTNSLNIILVRRTCDDLGVTLKQKCPQIWISLVIKTNIFIFLSQIFHMCDEDGRRIPYMCGNETSFNQKFRVCDWNYNVDCASSPDWWVTITYSDKPRRIKRREKLFLELKGFGTFLHKWKKLWSWYFTSFWFD